MPFLARKVALAGMSIEKRREIGKHRKTASKKEGTFVRWLVGTLRELAISVLFQMGLVKFSSRLTDSVSKQKGLLLCCQTMELFWTFVPVSYKIQTGLAWVVCPRGHCNLSLSMFFFFGHTLYSSTARETSFTRNEHCVTVEIFKT